MIFLMQNFKSMGIDKMGLNLIHNYSTSRKSEKK